MSTRFDDTVDVYCQMIGDNQHTVDGNTTHYYGIYTTQSGTVWLNILEVAQVQRQGQYATLSIPRDLAKKNRLIR